MVIVNCSLKQTTEWFVQEFDKQFTLDKKVEKMEMKFHFTKKKPIHSKWVTQFYNHMSTKDDFKVIINVWKRSCIFEPLINGSSALLSIDLFQDIAALPSNNVGGNEIFYPIEVREDFVNLCLATVNNFNR